MNASLNEKLRTVKWGEYKIEDLFQKLNLSFKKKTFDKKNDISTEKTDEFCLPLVNAKDGNNGIMYFGRPEDFESAELTLDIVNDGAISTGNVYAQPQRTGVLYNAYLIKPLFKTNPNLLYFFACTMQKSIKHKYGYENKAGWEKVKKEIIQLPVKNGEIDFDFMESFIAELEAQRVAELSAYLTVSGYDNYELSAEELNALREYPNIKFDEFDIFDIFTVRNTSNILSSDIVENSGKIPYLCASSENNAVNSYIEYDKAYLERGNCIFIGGKTFVVSYQEKDFYSNDSHNLALYLNNNLMRTKSNQLFIATCVRKSLSHKYSWGNSVSKAKIKGEKILLPTKNGQPDFDIMDILISAIHKLVIKDVVKYSDAKISVTKKVVTRE